MLLNITCETNTKMISSGRPISTHLATWKVQDSSQYPRWWDYLESMYMWFSCVPIYETNEYLPQENQTHTAQNQLDQPKEQQKVDLKTWNKEK